MSAIPLDRLIEYLRGYDEYHESYPEHPYEGEAVLQWVLECARSDGIISKEEFELYKIDKLVW